MFVYFQHIITLSAAMVNPVATVTLLLQPMLVYVILPLIAIQYGLYIRRRIAERQKNPFVTTTEKMTDNAWPAGIFVLLTIHHHAFYLSAVALIKSGQ